LGPGAFIENKAGILARIKNKDPKPDILSIPKTYEVFVGK
jgi:protein transport protein SEC24